MSQFYFISTQRIQPVSFIKDLTILALDRFNSPLITWVNKLMSTSLTGLPLTGLPTSLFLNPNFYVLNLGTILVTSILGPHAETFQNVDCGVRSLQSFLIQETRFTSRSKFSIPNEMVADINTFMYEGHYRSIFRRI